MNSNWIQIGVSESSLGTLTTKSLNQQIVSVGTLNSFYTHSHKSSKVMRGCIPYLLASALAPFHCKMFVEMFVTFSQSSQTQRIIHRRFEVNVEDCSLKCSSRLNRASGVRECSRLEQVLSHLS